MRHKMLSIILCAAGLLCQAPLLLAGNVRETPVVKAIQKSAPAVVNIGTEQTVNLQQHPFWGQVGGQFDAYYNSFFNMYGPSTVGTLQIQSLGSGIVVSPDGLIVTNAHVVGMASKIFVTMPDGQTRQAALIGTNNGNDIALIKIDAPKPLPYMGLAKDVLIGETVISVGNPLGLQNSVSAGIVGGTNRTFYTTPQIEAFKDLIQTDASINQGSSGGALINLEGKLVGMNLAVIQNAQGLGFAIPATKIKTMLEEYERVRPDKKKN